MKASKMPLLTDLAKNLRQESTPTEGILWQKLIIEVDGEVHGLPENQEADRIRQSVLENLGYRFLRFTTDDIYANLQIVLETIYATVA